MACKYMIPKKKKNKAMLTWVQAQFTTITNSNNPTGTIYSDIRYNITHTPQQQRNLFKQSNTINRPTLQLMQEGSKLQSRGRVCCVIIIIHTLEFRLYTTTLAAGR